MLVKFTTTVSLVTRTVSGQDSLGNDTYSDTPTSVDGVFAPGGTQELVQGQMQVITQDSVFIPDIDVSAVDQIVIGADIYEVDGRPRNWPANAFTGWRSAYPLQVPLKRVTG